jgi:ribosomal protein S12 methylthiotransferase
MALQAEMADKRSKSLIGSTIDVLVAEVDEEGAVGRSTADAPEIDGSVFIGNGQSLKQGDIVRAKIIAAEQVDLWAEV